MRFAAARAGRRPARYTLTPAWPERRSGVLGVDQAAWQVRAQLPPPLAITASARGGLTRRVSSFSRSPVHLPLHVGQITARVTDGERPGSPRSAAATLTALHLDKHSAYRLSSRPRSRQGAPPRLPAGILSAMDLRVARQPVGIVTQAPRVGRSMSLPISVAGRLALWPLERFSTVHGDSCGRPKSTNCPARLPPCKVCGTSPGSHCGARSRTGPRVPAVSQGWDGYRPVLDLGYGRSRGCSAPGQMVSWTPLPSLNDHPITASTCTGVPMRLYGPRPGPTPAAVRCAPFVLRGSRADPDVD